MWTTETRSNNYFITVSSDLAMNKSSTNWLPIKEITESQIRQLLIFGERGKPDYPEEKPLTTVERTNKHNPQIAFEILVKECGCSPFDKVDMQCLHLLTYHSLARLSWTASALNSCFK